MNEENLIKYYNKFNEDKRLTRRHGIVEYITTMKYIHKYLKTKNKYIKKFFIRLKDKNKNFQKINIKI